MRKFTYILCCLILLASCEERFRDMKQGQPIYLSVTIPDAPLAKVPFEGSAPTSSNPLNVSVWASTTPEVFLNRDLDGSEADGHLVSIHTYGHFQSGEPQLLSQAIYPPPRRGESGSYVADPVYFVAMHPQSSGQKVWSTDGEGKIANFTFTGCEDVMFAPQVYGAYDTQAQNQIVNVSPELAFEHLLTRISVKMVIVLEEDENRLDVQNAWGNVTGMKIQSYDALAGGVLEGLNRVTVDLSKGTSFDYSSDLSYDYVGVGSSIGTSMDFYCLGNDSTFPGAPLLLTDQVSEVAYVMCAPVEATDASHEYVITVTTENRGDQQVVLDLMNNAAGDKFVGSTRGKHFGVTLKFKKGSAIATSAAVTEWQNGGYGSGVIED